MPVQRRPERDTGQVPGDEGACLREGARVEAVDVEDVVLDRLVLDGQSERLRGVSSVREGPEEISGWGRAEPGGALPLGLLELEAIAAPELVERQIPRPAAAAQHPLRTRPVDVPGAVDPEGDRAQLVGTRPAGARLLAEQLRQPVGVVGVTRVLLVDREIPGNPVADGKREPGRSAGRGEDHLPDPGPHRRLENAERAVHVRLQHVERGRAERARDRCEVDDCARPGEAASKRLLVLEARPG